MEGNKNAVKLHSFLAGFLFAAILFIVFLISLNFVLAVWQEPTLPPPSGNVSPPLSTGSTNQVKSGGLTIGGVTTTTKLCFGSIGNDCQSTWNDILGVWKNSLNGIFYDDNPGNVGIGSAITGITDWPLFTAKLAINTGSAEGLYISRNSFVNYSYINVRDNADKPIFKVHESGKIGLGTDDPNSSLHIYNITANAEIDLQSVAGANKHWGIYNDQVTNDLRFWNDNVPGEKNTLVISDEGNMGIGTISPSAKLEVRGQAIFGSNTEVVASGQNLIYGDVDTTSGGNLLLLQKENINRFIVDVNGNATTTGNFHTTELCLDNGSNSDCKTDWAAVTPNGGWTDDGTIVRLTTITDNVGIGTTNPTQKLEVTGNVKINGNATTTGNFHTTELCLDNDCKSTWPSTGTTYWTQTGALLYPNNLAWNVGVGIANPTNPLHVYSATIDTVAMFESGDGVAGIRLKDPGGNGDIYTTAGNLWFRPGGATEAVRFTIGGNVGIGTSNPTRKLSILDGVSGPIASLSGLTNNYRGLSLRQSSDDTENWFIGANNSNNFVIRRNGSADDLAIDSSGNFTLSSLAGGANRCVQSDAAGKLINASCTASNPFVQSGNSFGALAVLGTNDNNGLALETSNIERVRIDTSGNVGIGLSNPVSKLEVSGDIKASGKAAFGGYGIDPLITLTTPSAFADQLAVGLGVTGGLKGTGTVNAKQLCLEGDCRADWSSIVSSGGWTDDGAAVRLTTATDNVGIGTASPLTKLHISGDGTSDTIFRISDPATTYDTGIELYRAAGTGVGAKWWLDNSQGNVYFDNLYNDNAGNIYFRTKTLSTPVTALTILGSGNIGIGTASPGAKLEVKGQTIFGSAAEVVGSGQNLVYGNIDTTSIGNLILLQNESVDKLKVDKDGNLILSSLAGGANRCVQSDINGKLVNTVCTDANPFVQNGNSFAALAFLGTNDNFGLIFETNNIERVRIDTAGNVGIGITNPDESLEIERAATSGKDAQVTLESTPSTAGKWSMRHDRTTDNLVFWNGGSNQVSFTNSGAVVAGALEPTQAGSWKFWSQGNIGVQGNVVVYGGNFYVSGADVAEEFESDSDLAKGTVVIMGDGGYKSVKASNKAYDQTVIGVVSDDAGMVMGHIGDDGKAQIAMVGVVGVKVTSENGAIKRGDLLVTSSLSGHAMKSTQNTVGMIIGKSLEDFNGQTGNIKALINLQ